MALPALGALIARAALGSALRGGGSQSPVTLPTRVDAEVEGIEELETAFRALAGNQQRSVMRSALRKGGGRIRERIVNNLSGDVVQVRTGELIGHFRTAKITTRARRGFVVAGVAAPPGKELAIKANAVEYGHAKAPAHPYIRPAVDEDAAGERGRIREDVGKGIDRLFKVKRSRRK